MPTKYVSKNIGEIAHNASSATAEVSASRCDVYDGLRLRRYKHSLKMTKVFNLAFVF
ncbi:hypothetical protein [Nostoc sp. JL33]|uniref:hypothetical protein n=1 Tax=Nostoc sp. JL33 TaxID=2815396 RepID=UPI0025CFFC3F|nr:hypothetical protein [Nostoc sp. JL33]MBN3871356.1 hypothetical protein [Nostoc sp. JL33]